jgi:hypothetical protein
MEWRFGMGKWCIAGVLAVYWKGRNRSSMAFDLADVGTLVLCLL